MVRGVVQHMATVEAVNTNCHMGTAHVPRWRPTDNLAGGIPHSAAAVSGTTGGHSVRWTCAGASERPLHGHNRGSGKAWKSV